ncbi:T9SS type A sorting domain-containing protein [Flavihumibacter petaseus]|nr:T9SS type A sorting domain-containing protein [Flavihumibacter petaseus]
MPLKFLPLSAILLLLTVLSCNLHNDRPLSTREVKDLIKLNNDSLMIELDSLSEIGFNLPPLYNPGTFDSATVNKFFELAKATDGEVKLLVNSKMVTNEIVDIINSHAENNADILFLIDKTGSMIDDIENVKQGLKQVIDAINHYHHIQLAVALYGDKNTDGPNWFSFKNFGNDYQAVYRFIHDISVTSGDDYPESVYDGFFKSCETGFWRSSSKRMILLIGDAPPLEKPLSDFTLADVIEKATADNIKMNFYPIVVMPYLFSEEIAAEAVNFEKGKVISMLYPNPTTGNLAIRFEKDDQYAIQIFNTSGSLILSDNFSGTTWKKNIGNLADGVFTVRAYNGNKKFETARFILSK